MLKSQKTKNSVIHSFLKIAAKTKANAKNALAFVFMVLAIHAAHAQVVITYDFKTGAFSAPIPYDEIINFELKNINGIPDSVVFIAFEKGKLNDTTSGKQVLRKTVLKSEIKSDSSVVFVSTTYFKPNRDYIFSITAHLKSRGLNQAEKGKLKEAFANDELIEKTITDLHTNAATSENRIEALDFQKNAQLDLDRRVLSIARNSLGPTVFFESTKNSRSKFLSEVGTYANALQNVFLAFDPIFQILENADNNLTETEKTTIRGDVNALKQNISALSEWPIKDDQTRAINAQLEASIEKYKDPKTKNIGIYLNAAKNEWAKFITAAKVLESAMANDKVLTAIMSDMQVANVANPSYPKAIQEQATGYFAIDFGMAYIPKIDQFVTFTQASFYFRPIKRSVPLRMYAGWDQLWARLSVDFGLTLNSVAKEDERRGFSFDQSKDATNALMIGLGFRVLSFAKVNAGAMIYQAKTLTQPDTDYSYTASLYVGVSIDLSLRGIVSENFGPKQVVPEP